MLDVILATSDGGKTTAAAQKSCAPPRENKRDMLTVGIHSAVGNVPTLVGRMVVPTERHKLTPSSAAAAIIVAES